MDINDRHDPVRSRSFAVTDDAPPTSMPMHQPPSPYAALVTNILQARAQFSDLFDASLFSDPAYDMLLTLFTAGEDGRTMTTNSCCAASRVPRTTALRWIKLLTARGHVIAVDDPNDRRQTLLRLSPAAREHVRGWLDEHVLSQATIAT